MSSYRRNVMGSMSTYREEEDLFEEDIVFDQARLLNNSAKMRTAIRRISSGKCALFAKTLGLCGAFFGLGLCIAIPGQTFMAPILALQADISPFSRIYTARSSGYLIGSIIGGFLFDHFNRLFLLFVSLLLTSIFITIVPWCQVFWLLEACMVILGISMGFLDTGGNVLCLDLWGRNSGPFMQALHFSFGLGAFVAPLLAAPFLEPKMMSNLQVNSNLVDIIGQNAGNLDHIHLFKSDLTSRLRRDVENATNFTNEDTIILNTSRNLFELEVINGSVSVVSEHVIKTPDNSSSSIDATYTPSVAIKSTRAPKPKPSKIDGRKLGDENWDKVPVGKPPMADLIPQSSTITTTEITTSQISMSTAAYEPQATSIDPTSTDGSLIINIPLPHEVESIIQTTNISLPSSEAYSRGDTSQIATSSSADLETSFKPGSDSINSSPNLMSYLTGREKHMEEDLLPTTTQSDPFLFKLNTEVKLQPESAMTKENDDSEYFLNDRNQNEEMSEEESKLATPLSNINGKLPGQGYGAPFELANSKVGMAPTSTTGPPQHIHHFKPGTYDNDTEDINSILDIFAKKIEKYGLNKVQFTHFMVGLFIFIISLVFLGFLCHNPRDPKSKQEEGQGAKVINKTLGNSLVGLMAVFLLLFVGLELAFGQMVVAFAIHSSLQLTQATGTILTAVFWGSFTAMRFASIFFASGLSPIWMLTLNLILCTTGTIVLSAFANSTETALWAGTVLVGIGLASIFPTSILWMERYIHVTNKVAAVLVVGVSLGEMICPIMIYHLMVTNPSMLMHASLVINFVCIIIFAILRWLASRLGEKYCVVNNNGYQLANQNEEEEDMMDLSPSDSRLLQRRYSSSAEHRALLNGSLH